MKHLAFINRFWQIPLIFLIMYIAFSIRTILVPSTVADYDPWWYYRHSLTVLKNGFSLPKWDILSFYPPGRPYERHQGLAYTLVLFYKLLKPLLACSFMKFFIIAPAVIAGLSTVPAYLTVKHMSGSKLGGLFASFFATLAPSFISYSVAGYMDSKVFVVFYSFLSIYALMLAMKKKTVVCYIFATLTNLLFIWTWASGGWYPILSFLFFLPAVLAYRLVEEVIRSRKLTPNLVSSLSEIRELLVPFLVIMLLVNGIAQFFLSENMFQGILSAFGFLGIVPALLVNISVAELQPINIFAPSGFYSVASHVGFLPTLLTLIGLPLLVVYKLWKGEKTKFEEIFLFLFALISFYMILHGVRFALIFSVASALSSGYVIANLYTYLEKDKLVLSFFLGTLILLSIQQLSSAYNLAKSTSHGYGISENWINALDWLKQNGNSTTLVATWWDPGHIITGYTGLKVHADGAHCGPAKCFPYNHNIRIQDMGKVFSTTDEKEALQILKKYMYLDSEQCEEVKRKFGEIVYDNILNQDPCTNSTTLYFIASNDLIGKYYWLTYFGTGDGRQYIHLQLYRVDNTKNVSIYCPQDPYGPWHPAYPWHCDRVTLTLAIKENKLVPILNTHRIRNAIVKNVLFFLNDQPVEFVYRNATNSIEGLVFVNPGYRSLFYMDSLTMKSILTNLYFFNGNGEAAFKIPKLEHFKLVYSNPEVKIFKVIF